MEAFLDADLIRAETFVRHVEVHQTLGSTNDRAAELARNAALELPALIAARHQTAGRGRGTNTWWAAEGALTFSILLDPAALEIHTAKWPRLSLATAVAICKAAGRECNDAELGIKWPNDVLLNGRKLAGILIESPASAKDRLVIGIGVNVNNAWRNVMPDAELRAIALCDATGRSHPLNRLLVRVLQDLHDCIKQLQAGDHRLVSTWRELNLLAGRQVAITSGDRRIEGTCAGLAEDGAIVLSTPRGERHLYSGTLRVLS